MEAFSLAMGDHMDGLQDSFPGLDDFLMLKGEDQHCIGFAKEDEHHHPGHHSLPPLLHTTCDGSPNHSSEASAVELRRAASSCTDFFVAFEGDSPRASDDANNHSDGSAEAASTGRRRANKSLTKQDSRKRARGSGSDANIVSRRSPSMAPPMMLASAAAEVAAAFLLAPKIEPSEYNDDDDDDLLMGGSGKGSGGVSHSTVEKRRRDRINTLIDLLAEQVPPLSAKYRHTNSAGVCCRGCELG